ncbi:MAG: hypothetical protein N2440_05010 [Actinobacteria bacterium]|nr:hypothetical protein [Actinomycetota bacterium]
MKIRKFLGFLSIVFLTILVFSTANAAFGIRKLSLQPAAFEFSAAPGAEINNSFKIENEGDENLSHVFVYSTNVKVDKNGKERYTLPLPEENTLNSPASWVYIKVPDPTKIIGNFPFLDLKKGEAKEVRFSIKIPDKAPPGDYTTIVFFEARSAQATGNIGTSIGARVGCRIKIRVQGEIIEDLVFDRLMVRKFVIGDIVPFEINLLNKGNIDAPGSVLIRIKNLSGSVIQEKYLSRRSYLYAHNNLQFSGAIKAKNLGFGVKNFESIFKYKDWQGNTKELRKEASFFVVPIQVFYILLFLIAALILLVSFWLDARLKKKGEAFKNI